jgi:branched-chain amino acid transport system substrate-binding protein
MDTSKKGYLAVGILVLMALVTLLIPVHPAVAQQKEPVKIGLFVPLTGPSAFGGVRNLRGTELAVEEINALGGVLGGRPIQLIVEDDESQPKGGMDAIHKLIDVNKVPIVIGTMNSSVTIPTATYSNSRGVVHVSLSATSPDLRKLGPYHFTVIATDEVMGGDVVKFAMKDSQQKKFGILVMNDAYGVGIAKAMRTVIEKMGGEVASEVRYELNKTDYRAELQRLFAPKPGAIISVSWSEMSRTIMKQAYEMGLMKTVQGKWYLPYFQDSVEAAIPETIEGVKGLDVVSAVGARFDKFAANYLKKVKGNADLEKFISYYPVIAYDAMWISAIAINMAGSTNSEAIKNVLPTVFEFYRGVSDPDMSVDEDGIQVTQIYQPYVFKNGKSEILKVTF